LPETRIHRCFSATRGYLIAASPKNKSLNWFIPAFVNINVGSFFTTTGADGTILCPLLLKKSKKAWRISLLVIYFVNILLANLLKIDVKRVLKTNFCHYHRYF